MTNSLASSLAVHEDGIYGQEIPLPYSHLSAAEFQAFVAGRTKDIVGEGRPEWTWLGLELRRHLWVIATLPEFAHLLVRPADGSLDHLRRTAEERVWALTEPFLRERLTRDVLASWQDMLRIGPDGGAGSDSAVAALDPYVADPELLLSDLRIGHYESMADALLRAAPEAYRSLLVLSVETQMAQYVLLKRWLLQEDPHPSDDEFSHAEKKLIALFGGFMKDFNSAFLAQSFLGPDITGDDTVPFDSDEVGHAARGADYLFHDQNTNSTGPASRAFPAEMLSVSRRYLVIAEYVESSLSGPEYVELPKFLRLLAKYHDERSNDPAVIGWLVSEINGSYKALQESGCRIYPIFGNNPGNLTPAADVEYRLAVVTKEAEMHQQLIDTVRKKIEERVLPEFVGRLDPQYLSGITRLDITSSFWPTSPNNYWDTRGESIEGMQLAHHDAVGKVARLREIPALERMFLLDESIDADTYHRGAVLDTSIHEIWHQFGSTDDSTLMARLIENDQNNKESILALAEFKSEAGTSRWVLAAREELEAAGLDLRTMLFVRLGALCDALRFKWTEVGTSGARYHYAQVAILGKLFDEGLVRKEGDRYRVDGDTEKILETIADLSRELESLFLDPGHEPGALDTFYAATRERAERSDIMGFLAKLKSA